MTRAVTCVAGIAGLVVGLGHCLPAAATTPARASGGDPPPGKSCVTAEEAGARAAGGDDAAPPKFGAAFYALTFTLDASLDGLDGKRLPVSIEVVCDIPPALKKQAVQLAGGDGIAVIAARTRIRQGDTRLLGRAATRALDGADTADLRVRLAPLCRWGVDEDGNKVPTFRTRGVTITD
jgi:hypothetical protein